MTELISPEVAYVIIAAIVVWLSVKASQYIDMLDKTTDLSGAFLGGVLLSAVTSLPELFTSISATMLLQKPGLCIGNILGSNLFNMAVLALLGLAFIRGFGKARIAKGNIMVTLFIVLIYCALALKWLGIIDFEIWTLNVITLVIALLYAAGVRYLAAGEQNDDEDGEAEVTLSRTQIVVRFVLVSAGIIFASICMTYVTDAVATKWNIGAGLAGALFLGVATSLPEVSSTAALFRMRSYDIAVGNIVGSNLFNFIVLCIADVLCFRQDVYDFADPQVVNLLVFGGIATVAMLCALRIRNTGVRVATLIAAAACYAAFLTIKLPFA